MIIIGHRGARKEAPENTVAGFVHAQQVGCHAFELDVHLSADQELMVIHDSTLTRTTGYRKQVAHTSSRQMAQLDARRHTAPWPTPCGVPTLQEVINATPHCIHWQFEVKTDSRFRLAIVARKIADLIHREDLYDTVAVTSADRHFLSIMQQDYPQIKRGLVAEFASPDPVDTATSLNCSLLCINRTLADINTITRAHQAGLHVSVWTVNNLEEMTDLAARKIDSLITDRPTIALSLFEKS